MEGICQFDSEDLFKGDHNKYFIVKYKLKTCADKCIQNNVFFLKRNQETSLRKAIVECHQVGIFLSCIDVKAFYAFGLVQNEPTEFVYLSQEQQLNLDQIKDQYQQYVKVQWEKKGVLTFDKTGSLKNELNENKPINQCRDVQELTAQTAAQLYHGFQDAKPLKIQHTDTSLHKNLAEMIKDLSFQEVKTKERHRSRSKDKRRRSPSDRKRSESHRKRSSSRDHKKRSKEPKDRDARDNGRRKNSRDRKKDSRSKHSRSKERKHKDTHDRRTSTRWEENQNSNVRMVEEQREREERQRRDEKERRDREERERREREEKERREREEREKREKEERERKEREEKERRERERREREDREKRLRKEKEEKDRKRQKELDRKEQDRKDRDRKDRKDRDGKDRKDKKDKKEREKDRKDSEKKRYRSRERKDQRRVSKQQESSSVNRVQTYDYYDQSMSNLSPPTYKSEEKQIEICSVLPQVTEYPQIQQQVIGQCEVPLIPAVVVEPIVAIPEMATMVESVQENVVPTPSKIIQLNQESMAFEQNEPKKLTIVKEGRVTKVVGGSKSVITLQKDQQYQKLSERLIIKKNN